MKHISHIFLLAFILTLLAGCEPHANYPVTHRVGWITNENINWEVLELSANFKHQKFNLNNAESHIIIKAKVKVFEHEKSTQQIKELHINQRYIEDKVTFALIEITPIYKSSENNTNLEPAVFDLLINEPIQNRDWGSNYYRVKIGNKQVDLETSQGK